MKITQQFIDDFNKAETLCNQGDLEASLHIYQSLMQQQPNQVAVLNNIGLIYEKRGNYHKAAEYYRQCYEISPEQVIFAHNLANALTQVQDWTNAKPLLEVIAEKEFENEKNTEKLALCLFNAESKQQANKFTETALKKYPDNSLLNRLHGRSLLHLNQALDGLAYLQKGAGMIELNSNGVRYLN